MHLDNDFVKLNTDQEKQIIGGFDPTVVIGAVSAAVTIVTQLVGLYKSLRSSGAGKIKTLAEKNGPETTYEWQNAKENSAPAPTPIYFVY